MQGQAASLRGRGVDLSNTIASLEPFAEEANTALRLLDTQSEAVSGLIRNSGEVFGALSERQGQLRGLIENTNAVFETTARRNEDLADRVQDLPDLPARVARDPRPARTVRRATTTRSSTRCGPTANEVEPTFASLGRLSHRSSTRSSSALRTTIDRSQSGFSALRGDPRRRPAADPRPPRPVPRLVQLAARGPAPLQARDHRLPRQRDRRHPGLPRDRRETNLPVHYLRTEAPLTPEVLSTYRAASTQPREPVLQARWLLGRRPASRLQVVRDAPVLRRRRRRPCRPRDATIADPAFNVRTDGDLDVAADYYDRIKLFAFNDQHSTATIGVAALRRAAPVPLDRQPEETSDYLHVYPQP